jgi:uncharacterized protein (DUF433 family)
MDYENMITLEPIQRRGQPCIRGLRMTVADVLGHLAAGSESRADSIRLPIFDQAGHPGVPRVCG